MIETIQNLQLVYGVLGVCLIGATLQHIRRVYRHERALAHMARAMAQQKAP